MRVAVIGSGISGLGAAYLLNKEHEVLLYERNDYHGGHTRTVEVEIGSSPAAVDTGFIVFNYRNYPLLTGLFEELDVPVYESDMSFAVSVDQGWLEYGTRNLSSIVAQPANLLRPPFVRMIRDVFRFNKQALSYLDASPSISLQQCLEELKMSDWFRDYYLLPMAGSIWSCPVETMLDFPATTLIRFFHNHGLLTVNDQPQWYTVQGGAREYVRRIIDSLGSSVCRPAAKKVSRIENGAQVEDAQGRTETVDHVVFACHANEALALLSDPSDQERGILSKFSYQTNEIVLHRDVSLMPKRKAAWASWVYLLEGRDDTRPSISLSYWMNNLQSQLPDTPLIVTLNAPRQPEPDKVYDRHTFEHPVFDELAIQGQQQIPEIQGARNTWFCGAYQRYGFHEDGLWSAVRVVKGLGVEVPWV